MKKFKGMRINKTNHNIRFHGCYVKTNSVYGYTRQGYPVVANGQKKGEALFVIFVKKNGQWNREFCFPDCPEYVVFPSEWLKKHIPEGYYNEYLHYEGDYDNIDIDIDICDDDYEDD